MNDHLFCGYKVKDFQFACSSQVLAYLSLRSDEITSFPYEDIKLESIIKYNDLVNFLNQNWK